MPRALQHSVTVHAGVEEVFSALAGPGWPAALEAALHDDSRLLRCEAAPDGGALLETSRRLPASVPGPLRRFAPADGRVTQTDTWGPAEAGTRRGTWTVTYAGSPGAIDGEHLLEPVDGGTRWTVTGTVTVRVPLLGGQVEGFLAPLVEKLVDRQGEVLRDALA